MNNFVLVHGGSHAAWCWQYVVPLLGNHPRVDQVVALDLVGHGSRKYDLPPEEIRLAHYIDDVTNAISDTESDTVILVGHSAAGAIIPAAVARVPDAVKRVIYLATSNPPTGSSLMDLMTHPLSPISRSMDLETMFCNDLDEQRATWLMSQLEAEPPAPFEEPVTHTTLPDGIQSTYVVLELDQALPVEYQLEQAGRAQVSEIKRIQAGHSVFASRPTELADLLLTYT